MGLKYYVNELRCGMMGCFPSGEIWPPPCEKNGKYKKKLEIRNEFPLFTNANRLTNTSALDVSVSAWLVDDRIAGIDSFE